MSQTPQHRCAGATSSIVPRPAPRCHAKARCKPSPTAPAPRKGERGGRGSARWAAVRGNILARCVPRRPSAAIFSLHVSPKGPGTGKAPLPGKIRAPCIQNELALARYARRVSEKPRKSPFGNAPREDLAREGRFSLHGPLESCTARESCHPVSTNRPSARGLGAAERREPPATTATPSWRGSLRNAPPDTAPNRPSARNLGSAERRQTARNRYAEAQLESQRHGLAELC